MMNEPTTKQIQAYKKIKEMILTGELPENCFLVERKMCEQLGISRTPVHAALSDLCAECLVVNYPGRGMVVSQVTIEDVVEIYQIRNVLDTMAFREILTFGNDTLINEMCYHTEQMKLHIDNGEVKECMEHDMAFHDCYYLSVRNRRLSKIMLSLRDQIHRFLNLTVNDNERIEQTYIEHKRIIDAVNTGETEKACRALAEHLYQARDYHLNRINKAILIERD